jgi:hypothetical protein
MLFRKAGPKKLRKSRIDEALREHGQYLAFMYSCYRTLRNFAENEHNAIWDYYRQPYLFVNI